MNDQNNPAVQDTAEQVNTVLDNPFEELSDGHYRMLHEESGIPIELIKARGYRTITSTNDLLQLGFAPKQRRVPGLLLPLHPTDGGSSPVSVYRPNNPRKWRSRDGSKTSTSKYEMPKGKGSSVDCPPVCRGLLDAPRIPLWITEGQKKGDALAAKGLCAIALLGVWSWKSRNAHGGTTFTNDFDYVALDNRDVRIVYDSDVMTK